MISEFCTHRSVCLNPIQDGGGGEEGGGTVFLTFSFNPFVTLVQNFKFVSSASPKLLNLNQDHLSKKAIFLLKSL